MQFSSYSDSEVGSIQNEIDLLRGLSHPNIVRYLGTEKGDLQLNIFLEYASGGSLRQQLNENWGKVSGNATRAHAASFGTYVHI